MNDKIYAILQVESIVLSIISMLSSPNDESPANVEAAVSLITILIYMICLLVLCSLFRDKIRQTDSSVNFAILFT